MRTDFRSIIEDTVGDGYFVEQELKFWQLGRYWKGQVKVEGRKFDDTERRCHFLKRHHLTQEKKNRDSGDDEWGEKALANHIICLGW